MTVGGFLGPVLAVTVLAPPALVRRPSTYERVVGGMKCSQTGHTLECDYRVGRDLHFIIAGVGEADASITFHSASFDGDYYASVGVAHGCVIVKPGKAADGGVSFDVAFVSPRSGKVYSDWESCRGAK